MLQQKLNKTAHKGARFFPSWKQSYKISIQGEIKFARKKYETSSSSKTLKTVYTFIQK